MEEKMDRRVRRTKRQLRTALTTLMLEKNVGDITVREIADLADVNRGTFYSHYTDVSDLLNQLEQNIFTRLDEVRQANDPKACNGSAFNYIHELLVLVGDNADICMALICRNTDINFHKDLSDALKKQFVYDFFKANFPADEDLLKYYCSFTVCGIISVMTDWLCSGQKETPYKLAAICNDFIMKGAAALSR